MTGRRGPGVTAEEHRSPPPCTRTALASRSASTSALPGGLSGDGVADLAFGGGSLFNGPVPAGSLTGDGHEDLLLGASSWNGPAQGYEGALFAFPNEGE